MAKYIKIPFAKLGDKATIPDEAVGLEVNYATGYTSAYESDPDTDPTARYVERDGQNQLFFVLSSNIKEWQEHIYPSFITSAENDGSPFPYDKGMVVRYLGVNYISLEANNQDTPPSSKWELFVLGSASGRDIGTSTIQVPDNAQLNARFGGYTGNLGTAARFDTGSGTLSIVNGSELNTRFGGYAGNLGTAARKNTGVGSDEVPTNADLGTAAQQDIGSGANQVPDKEILDSRFGEGNNVMVGAIVPFAMTSAPSGWIKANGAAISRTTYAQLFSKIGTTHGAGNGSTTFNVPDLRGEFVRMWDDGRGIDSGRVFGSFQADEFKSHSHTLPVRDNNNTGDNYIEDADSTQLIRTANTGSTGGDETRPRNIALAAYIKY